MNALGEGIVTRAIDHRKYKERKGAEFRISMYILNAEIEEFAPFINNAPQLRSMILGR